MRKKTRAIFQLDSFADLSDDEIIEHKTGLVIEYDFDGDRIQNEDIDDGEGEENHRRSLANI